MPRTESRRPPQSPSVIKPSRILAEKDLLLDEQSAATVCGVEDTPDQCQSSGRGTIESPRAERLLELERLVQPRQKLAGGKRFGQIGVCPGKQPRLDVGPLGRGGEQYHLDRGQARVRLD